MSAKKTQKSVEECEKKRDRWWGIGIGNVPMVDASSSESGRIGIHPCTLRKSGKQKTCGIRNLEECTEDGRWDARGVRETVNTRPRSEESRAERTNSAGLMGSAESGAKNHNPCWHEILTLSITNLVVSKLRIGFERKRKSGCGARKAKISRLCERQTPNGQVTETCQSVKSVRVANKDPSPQEERAKVPAVLMGKQRVQVVGNPDVTANLSGVQEIRSIRPTHSDGDFQTRVLQF